MTGWRFLPIFLLLALIYSATGGILTTGCLNDQYREQAVTVADSYTPHEPITISSNADFSSQGWPGSGTQEDPYVIEGLSITDGNSISISISGTDVYFEIKNCLISASSISGYCGIALYEVSYGVVSDCHIEMRETGIYHWQSTDLTLMGNTLIGNDFGVETEEGAETNLHLLNRFVDNSVRNAMEWSYSNRWDNGTHGNYWDDYDGSGTYSIPGDTGTVDNHPYQIDNIPPSITGPSDFSYEDGTTGHVITWSPDDLNPQSYEIYINGLPHATGSWDGNNITISVDGLQVGIHNHTLVVYDILDNNAIDSVLVSVVDTTPPTIDSGTDVEYECGTTGHTITWNAHDLNPQSYEVHRNGMLHETGSWDGSSILVEVDDLHIGSYNYTLVLRDTSENSASDTVMVTVVDTTPPTIDSGTDVEYECGTTGHTITWDPADLNPSNYTIYRNGTLVRTGAWNSSSEQVTVCIDSFEVGAYNYTLVVHDTSENCARAVIMVAVQPMAPPVIASLQDMEYECGTTDHWITWLPEDLSPLSYEVYLDGILVKAGAWNSSSEQVTVCIDGLELGVYNFTLVVYDALAYSASDTVMVTVRDTTPPTIDSGADVEYECGTTGHTITWNVVDLNPSNYTIYRNGTLVRTGAWNSSSEQVIVCIDGLEVGAYIYTLVVYDTSGNSATDSVLLSVLDTTPPTIDGPTDLLSLFETTGNIITWNPYDLNPRRYEVYQNDILVRAGAWNSSVESITISIDGLAVGIYNYTLVAYDASDNSAHSAVIVTVVDGTPPTIDNPADIIYLSGLTGNTITWTPSDLSPSSYEVYQNGTLVKAGLWNSSAESITISIDGLKPGIYNYTVVVYDILGNSARHTVMVTVMDSTRLFIEQTFLALIGLLGIVGMVIGLRKTMVKRAKRRRAELTSVTTSLSERAEAALEDSEPLISQEVSDDSLLHEHIQKLGVLLEEIQDTLSQAQNHDDISANLRQWKQNLATRIDELSRKKREIEHLRAEPWIGRPDLAPDHEGSIRHVLKWVSSEYQRAKKIMNDEDYSPAYEILHCISTHTQQRYEELKQLGPGSSSELLPRIEHDLRVVHIKMLLADVRRSLEKITNLNQIAADQIASAAIMKRLDDLHTQAALNLGDALKLAEDASLSALKFQTVALQSELDEVMQQVTHSLNSRAKAYYQFQEQMADLEGILAKRPQSPRGVKMSVQRLEQAVESVRVASAKLTLSEEETASQNALIQQARERISELRSQLTREKLETELQTVNKEARMALEKSDDGSLYEKERIAILEKAMERATPLRERLSEHHDLRADLEKLLSQVDERLADLQSLEVTLASVVRENLEEAVETEEEARTAIKGLLLEAQRGRQELNTLPPESADAKQLRRRLNEYLTQAAVIARKFQLDDELEHIIEMLSELRK